MILDLFNVTTDSKIVKSLSEFSWWANELSVKRWKRKLIIFVLTRTEDDLLPLNVNEQPNWLVWSVGILPMSLLHRTIASIEVANVKLATRILFIHSFEMQIFKHQSSILHSIAVQMNRSVHLIIFLIHFNHFNFEWFDFQCQWVLPIISELFTLIPGGNDWSVNLRE